MKHPLRILFITPSYKPAFVYGGPTVSVSTLAEALVNEGAAVTVFTTTANGKEELLIDTSGPVELSGVSVHYFKRITGDHTHVSPALWRKLYKTIDEFDVVHVQSWWSLLVFGAAIICTYKRKPFIVAPRGMLSRYSFENLNTGFKKWLHRLIGAPLLRRSYLHATTKLEWEDCLLINQGWKGFVLPNLVKFPAGVPVRHAKREDEPLVFGFLSRIDPKKGLEYLITALAQVSFPFRLLIAGQGEEAYVDSLKRLAITSGISEKVEWCGWKNETEKFDFLKSVDVFTLISHNENFANVVIESLSVGTGVLLSNRVGLADYVLEKGFGWVSDREIPQLVSVLNEIYRRRHALAVIATEAPIAVQTDFQHHRLAQQYLNAYRQIYHLVSEEEPGQRPGHLADDRRHEPTQPVTNQ